MICAPFDRPQLEKALRPGVKISGQDATPDSRLLPGYCLILRNFHFDRPPLHGELTVLQKGLSSNLHRRTARFVAHRVTLLQNQAIIRQDSPTTCACTKISCVASMLR